MNVETTDLPGTLPVSIAATDAAEAADPAPEGGEERRKKKGKKEKKGIGSDRGIETMFRTSYQMHVEMSGLADSKANILISINGLIISVILAAISPKIDANPWLLLPTAVVLVSCLISMSFSILAARPRLGAGQGSAAAPRAEPDNLIFFGSFVGLDAAEYERRLLDLIRTRDELYRHMIRDIYGLGKVLERKFALLGRAYTIFLAGLILGVLLYLVVFVAVVFRGTPPG